MKAELVFNLGQVRLAAPLYLKADAPIHMTIEVAEEYIAPSRDWFPEEFRLPPTVAARRPPAKPGSLQEELNIILGPLALTRPGASIGDDHQSYLEAIEERYFGH